jgi:hypothetical protein
MGRVIKNKDYPHIMRIMHINTGIAFFCNLRDMRETCYRNLAGAYASAW